MPSSGIVGDGLASVEQLCEQAAASFQRQAELAQAVGDPALARSAAASLLQTRSVLSEIAATGVCDGGS